MTSLASHTPSLVRADRNMIETFQRLEAVAVQCWIKQEDYIIMAMAYG